MQAHLPKYVLVTPARNEAAFIERTITSVIAQTVLPVKWVIVSDGSTDGTDEIVSKYAATYTWIELVRLPERAERNFAGKAAAFKVGQDRADGLEYNLIANLDGDVSFEPDYLAFLLGKFADNPRLGVAGTPYREEKAIHDERFKSPEHVSGACQMFRRECFEDIGGYPPVSSGGIDLIALLSAQAKGWQTKRFDDRFCLHHRNVGSGQHAGVYRRLLNLGKKDYLLGSHPFFEIFRCAFQMKNSPYVVGGILMIAGYAWAMIRGVEPTMPKQLIRIRRNDQMQRLKDVFRHPLRHGVDGRLLRHKRRNQSTERNLSVRSPANMAETECNGLTIGRDDLILVTGATGFIGSRLLRSLLDRGFRNVRCLARPSSDTSDIEAVADRHSGARVEVVTGNLLSRDDCKIAARDVAVIFHLAAGTGQKSFPDAFMNSVVTTRNLLEASAQQNCLKRFVSVSSFAVYTNSHNPRGRLLDESCPVEERADLRGEAYCFAKVKQEEIVTEYCKKLGIPYVTVRPGYVYGPGKAISSRVGVDTFGIFLHLGGSNTIPLTYVDNCAEAIALAGLKTGIEGEIFNVVDDDLPTSRQFLRLYKRNVKRIRSVYVPHMISYSLCYLWERYSKWSEGQLPPAFNRRRWNAYWKKTRYSNEKLKTRLGWTPRVPTAEGFKRYFEACGRQHA